MVWASLDGCLDMLLASVLDCTEDQANCLATQVDRVSSRMDLIKSLSVTTKMTSEWKVALVDALGWMNANLSGRRNRIIHDAWDFSEPSPVQIDKRVKVRRGQSREPYAIHTNLKTEVTAESIEQLITEVSYAATVVLTAKTDIDSSRACDWQPLKTPILPIALQILITLDQRNSPPLLENHSAPKA